MRKSPLAKRTKKRKKLADGTPVPSDATLDMYMSQYIRMKGECELYDIAIKCGGTLEHHHVTPRTKSKALRWHPLNGLCLCQYHHSWFHSNPISSARTLDELFGKERWDECDRIKREERVPTREDKIALLKWLKEELSNGVR